MASHFDFDYVPVVDVHIDNFKEVWPSLVLALKSATFVAMDTELSGLGNRRLLNAKSIEDRYTGLTGVAKSRSVLSLGISCFKLKDISMSKLKDASTEISCDEHGISEKSVNIRQWEFLVQTFNILVLCCEDYMVEPLALQFLVSHGFDFNKQYAKGVPYYRGNDKTEGKEKQTLRQLFSVLVQSKSPVVFHNAFVDLVFIYQSFYANLPPSSASFLADLTEIFEGGVYDTKYVTEYKERLPASYLQYVFRKCQRENAFYGADRRVQVSLEFLDYPASYLYVKHCNCTLPRKAVELGDIPDEKNLRWSVCDRFAAHGWCPQGTRCPMSHDIDSIIDLDELKPARRSRKRKRRNRNKNKKSAEIDENKEESEGENESFESRKAVDEDQTVNESMEVSGGEYSSNFAESFQEEPEMPLAVSLFHSENMASGSESQISDVNLKNSSKSENTFASSANLDNSSILVSLEKQDRETEIARSGGHRAGYDAFMTGYIFAYFLSKKGKVPEIKTRNLGLSELGAEDVHNKIYLCGKDIPMCVAKSAFAKTSKDHKDKIQRIKGV